MNAILDICNKFVDEGWIYDEHNLDLSHGVKNNFQSILFLDGHFGKRECVLCKKCIQSAMIFYNEFFGPGGRGYFSGPLANAVLYIPNLKGILDVTAQMKIQKKPITPLYFIGDCTECSNISCDVAEEFLVHSLYSKKIKYDHFPFFAKNNKGEYQLLYTMEPDLKTAIKSLKFPLKFSSEIVNYQMVCFVFDKAKLKGIVNKMLKLNEYDEKVLEIENRLLKYSWQVRFCLFDNDNNMTFDKQIKWNSTFCNLLRTRFYQSLPTNDIELYEHVINIFKDEFSDIRNSNLRNRLKFEHCYKKLRTSAHRILKIEFLGYEINPQ